MPLRFGLHTGPQNVDVVELQRLWRRADEAGFNLSILPPVDWDALEAFVADVMPSVR